MSGLQTTENRKPRTFLELERVQRVHTVHFEVNQQPYFLNFIPEEGRWFLFKATRSGIEAVPVVNDDEAPLFPDEIEVDSDPEVVN